MTLSPPDSASKNGMLASAAADLAATGKLCDADSVVGQTYNTCIPQAKLGRLGKSVESSDVMALVQILSR
ncbi:hypothetical protein WIA93_24615 [Citrobacter amalonaticus]|uniref:hypothetical protein n=1 Tax=Citrobacter amalonaticus TaxID=35703 RepID=UPI00339CFD78